MLGDYRKGITSFCLLLFAFQIVPNTSVASVVPLTYNNFEDITKIAMPRRPGLVCNVSRAVVQTL